MRIQEPANEREFVTISEPHWLANEPRTIAMTVKIDMLANRETQLVPIMRGIANAVEKYVEKEKAAEIFAGIEEAVREQVARQVKQFVEKECYAILSKIDLDTMAKLATIGAAKKLGTQVGK